MSPTVNFRDWQSRARRRLPRFVFDYLDGGADDEAGLHRNIAALQRVLLMPERCTDVATISLRTALFNSVLEYPMIVAPTGFNGLFWGDGDLAMARAAARAGIPFALSTASTSTIEEVAAATDAEKWFQLYVFGDRRSSERLLARASDAGYSALILTIDIPVNGNRERDRRNGFTFPPSIRPRLALDALGHPRWLLQLMRSGLPRLANFEDDRQGGDGRDLRTALSSREFDRTLTWRSIEWLRSHWHGPIVLKGILTASDARRARECGANSIVVSNHGGRQLDAFPATIDVLASIIDAVGPEFPVLIDSGFRRGTDIVKALALGATAVLVGRPLLYGLAAAGESGASAVLDSLAAEMARTIALVGVSDVRQLARRHVSAS